MDDIVYHWNKDEVRIFAEETDGFPQFRILTNKARTRVEAIPSGIYILAGKHFDKTFYTFKMGDLDKMMISRLKFPRSNLWIRLILGVCLNHF